VLGVARDARHDRRLVRGGPWAGRARGRRRARLEAEPPAGLPAWVEGNYPEWLAGSFERAFGEDAVSEGAGLSRRAPVDLRVNTLKATRDKVLKALARAGAEAGPWSPFAVRIPASVGDGRTPNVEAEPAHARGWFEVQDAGSQVAALMTAAQPGQQVVDVCAGAGGKTLALAAQMANKGQIHAYDADRHRLRPIFERLKRAGARNVQVIPADEPQKLEGLERGADVVLVDAPCSGSGSWRRRPDAKWRLSPEALERRVAEQTEALERGRGAGEAGRAAGLCDLLGAAGGERRSGCRFPGAASGLRRRSLRRRVARGDRQRTAAVGRRLRPDAAADAGPARHGRVLHRGAGARENDTG
jgi:16S rRNA (cytosine967-C5)-methyltransferase